MPLAPHHFLIGSVHSVAPEWQRRILSYMDIGQRNVSIRHVTKNKGHDIGHSGLANRDIVFDKFIFESIFHKDIRRVFIYKKAQRLANALYLIAPAFNESASLKGRIEATAVVLTEAACLPGAGFARALSRELLSLSSQLSMAQAGSLLSTMNTDLITLEARLLLADVAAYEEPRLALPESPTITSLAKQVPGTPVAERPVIATPTPRATRDQSASQGQYSIRQSSILSLIKDKGRVSIKDITLVVRGVSEKTVQRELQGLIDAGRIMKLGERRWSTYSLAPSLGKL